MSTLTIFRGVAFAIGATLAVTNTLAANVQSYSDKATFLNSSAAIDATGPLPATAIGTTFGTLAVGSVTFYAPRWVIGEYTLTLPGNEIGISIGTGNTLGGNNDGIDTTFVAPVYSAGFDFMEPIASGGADGFGCNVVPCLDSNFQITLRNGAATIASFSFNAPNDVSTFVGVWSDTAFTRMEIRETVGTDDNEYYGRFYTGAIPMPVPEPSMFVLLGLGVIGLASRFRQRK